jgi:hypothetical protein
LPASTCIDLDRKVKDEVLMAQLSEGNEEALAVLFRRYACTVRAIAYRAVRDASEASSIEQVFGGADFENAFTKRSPNQRETIPRHCFEGCTFAETAADLGQSRGNIIPGWCLKPRVTDAG